MNMGRIVGWGEEAIRFSVSTLFGIASSYLLAMTIEYRGIASPCLLAMTGV